MLIRTVNYLGILLVLQWWKDQPNPYAPSQTKDYYRGSRPEL